MKFWRVVIVAALSLARFALFAGTNGVTFATVPQGSEVNLTTEGKLDWVHWGLYTDSSFNRKAGVPALINDFIPQDSSNGYAFVYQYADNYNGYTWSDGLPEIGATNTPTGVWAYGVPNIGSGFRFTVPADTTPRTLKVFVGVFAGMGQFEARLSDDSAVAYTNATLQNFRNGPGRVYTVNYAADSAGQTLTIRWTLTRLFDPTANVTLQAAALSAVDANNPPFAVMTNQTNGKFSMGTAIMLGAKAFDSDGEVTRVEFFDKGAKLGEDGTAPFTYNWNGTTAGHHIVSARAVDNLGGSRMSHPIDVFVHGSGGTLSGAMAFPPGIVNLTAEGTADWTHWGLTNANSLNRKAGVGPQINMVILGTHLPTRFTNNYTSFAWSDGAPVASESGTSTGIYITGFTNGFKITVPADTVSRTLRVYTGLYGAAGTLQAFLSDGSAAAYTDASLDDIYSSRYAVHTIDYRAASAEQTLTVQYRASRVYDMDYGNLTFPAVTLQGPVAPAPLRLLNPRRAGGSLVFDFNTQMGQTYTVQYAPQLSSGGWQTLSTISGSGGLTNVIVPTTEPSRFYRVRVP